MQDEAVVAQVPYWGSHRGSANAAGAESRAPTPLSRPAHYAMHRVGRLAAHLLQSQPSATEQQEVVSAAVLADPPENWPDWLPFPVHTDVPRFALGDPEANEFLEREGYAVIKDVLGPEEVHTALEKLWHEIETRSDGVVRSDPSTWDNGWRTNGWGHDEFLWYVRSCPNVRKVWEQMHDTDDVIVSFDGANIQKPWGLNPDWRGGAGTMHTDRRNHEGVQDGYIQGFVNLRPTSAETGGNYVVPRSHHFYHELEEWKQSLPQEERSDFYAKAAKERPELFQEVITAHLEPGDVFLWTDMTLHQACPGRGVGPTEPELMRAACYVCMSPKSKATPEVIEERRKAVYHNTGNGHTAHHPMGRPGQPKIWEEPETPYPLERLTPAQRKLVG